MQYFILHCQAARLSRSSAEWSLWSLIAHSGAELLALAERAENTKVVIEARPMILSYYKPIRYTARLSKPESLLSAWPLSMNAVLTTAPIIRCCGFTFADEAPRTLLTCPSSRPGHHFPPPPRHQPPPTLLPLPSQSPQSPQLAQFAPHSRLP